MRCDGKATVPANAPIAAEVPVDGAAEASPKETLGLNDVVRRQGLAQAGIR